MKEGEHAALIALLEATGFNELGKILILDTTLRGAAGDAINAILGDHQGQKAIAVDASLTILCKDQVS
jgi:hypothetical protein